MGGLSKQGLLLSDVTVVQYAPSYCTTYVVNAASPVVAGIKRQPEFMGDRNLFLTVQQNDCHPPYNGPRYLLFILGWKSIKNLPGTA